MQDIVLFKAGMTDSRTENGDREHMHTNNEKSIDLTCPELKGMEKCLD